MQRPSSRGHLTQPAIRNHDRPMRKLTHRRIVGRHNSEHPAAHTQLGDDSEQLRSGRGVQSAGGFVRQDDRPLPSDSTRESASLSLASRRLMRVAVSEVLNP
ncbi:protein of unknown function [Micropruina glycogenica]|uniref:Uncharacterized protein n=1 Tax=Micropruina glycogenica TaxID=75385 RepID=A0A2N9JIX4_9ACTN|nr:protein of unknown function [Micropruina glycogenica]